MNEIFTMLLWYQATDRYERNVVLVSFVLMYSLNFIEKGLKLLLRGL